MKQKRFLLDSTLRDGEQSPGICFSASQKLKIASILDYSGVHQIEAGIPAISKQEKEIIIRIIENRKNAAVSVWSRLVPSDIEHAIDTRPDIIHVSIPVSQIHIREKIRQDEDWVISQLRACLYIADKNCVPLSVGFEDAFRSDTGFMVTIAKILLDYGVTRIRLADTVGVASPSRCREVINELSESLDGRAELGMHAHNDFGMAVANTLEAAKAGCLYADVTVGGIGERAGNCNLAHLVQASSSLFNWGLTGSAARDLQNNIFRVIKPNRRTR
jgi:homocitrate synthase NifV